MVLALLDHTVRGILFLLAMIFVVVGAWLFRQPNKLGAVGAWGLAAVLYIFPFMYDAFDA